MPQNKNFSGLVYNTAKQCSTLQHLPKSLWPTVTPQCQYTQAVVTH